MLTIYVDGLIVAASGNAEIIWSEGKLHCKFEYTTQGRLKYCLSAEFVFLDDSVYSTLTQHGY